MKRLLWWVDWLPVWLGGLMLWAWLVACNSVATSRLATLPTLIPTLGVPEVTAVSPTATPIPPTTTPTPLPTPSLSATQPPTQTPTPTPTRSPYASLGPTPGQPQSYLETYRLVAYYGSITGPGLGILGNQSRAETSQLLAQTVAEYQILAPERPILPTFHIIVAVASPHPPYYYVNIDLALIEEWVAAAQELETAVVLDIQPGQGDVMYIYQRIRHLLYQPHVHLAVDPEFAMSAGQIPARELGSLSANVINELQADLNQIALEIGVNRVLILHQFADIMLPDKAQITNYPFVELVIDGDGVGSPTMKIHNYTQYAGETAFEYGGFKLFPVDGDYPVLTPAEVMSRLSPPPAIIIYQ